MEDARYRSYQYKTLLTMIIGEILYTYFHLFRSYLFLKVAVFQDETEKLTYSRPPDQVPPHGAADAQERRGGREQGRDEGRLRGSS